jgi:hypothetical protein
VRQEKELMTNTKFEYRSTKQIQMLKCSKFKIAEQSKLVIASVARRSVIASPQGVAISLMRSPRRFAPRDDKKRKDSRVDNTFTTFDV